MKISDIKSKVEVLLSHYKKAREDDQYLVALFWLMEAREKKMDLTAINGHELLTKMSEGVFTNSESIRRCRAKLQELNTSLRGDNYKERAKVQSSVKDDLKNNF